MLVQGLIQNCIGEVTVHWLRESAPGMLSTLFFLYADCCSIVKICLKKKWGGFKVEISSMLETFLCYQAFHVHLVWHQEIFNRPFWAVQVTLNRLILYFLFHEILNPNFYSQLLINKIKEDII